MGQPSAFGQPELGKARRIALIDLGQGPGHALYTGALCRALSAAGLELALTRQPCLPASAYGSLSEGLELEAAAGWSSGLGALLRQPLDLWRLRSHLRKFNPDLIHWVFPHPWMLLGARALGPYPWTSTLHDPQLHPGEDGRLSQLIQSAALRQSQSIIVLGEAMRRVAEQRFFAQSSKFFSSPHGHFNDHFAPLPPTKLASTSFLLFGRLSRYKGVGRALAAFRLLCEDWPEARLIVAGQGASEALRSIAGPAPPGLELKDGVQSAASLRALLEDCLAVLVPYEQASASGVIVTAAAQGRACIASELPALRELLEPGELGWLVDSEDPAQLAAAMSRLLERPALAQEAGLRARAGLAKTQSHEDLARAHIKAYEYALAQS